MKRIGFWFWVIALYLVVGFAHIFAQDKPPIPDPPQVTINDLRFKIADLVLQVDKQNEYIQTLRAKITELQAEIDKSRGVTALTPEKQP